MTTSLQLSIEERIAALETLVHSLQAKGTVAKRIQYLEGIGFLQETCKRLPFLRNIDSVLTQDRYYVLLLILAMGQADTLFSKDLKLGESVASQLNSLLARLSVVEHFYSSIGGLPGYHLAVLRLMQPDTGQKSPVQFRSPPGTDISTPNDEVQRATIAGLRYLPQFAEIYPIGGAGDRLGLVNEETQIPLPTACLPFGGKTLLEGLIRDLEAREALYASLFGQRIVTPLALMTSAEKDNHALVKAILEQNEWFGRPQESFFLFTQPGAPVITEEGNWAASDQLQLHFKPGGHGVIWRLLETSGGYDWLEQQGRKWALVRQINNPIAGIDYGLLAFMGLGCLQEKQFGFAACHRRVGSAEGVDVLFERREQEHYLYGISNIEYTDFTRHGIQDIPCTPDSPYSCFPSNTNILFVDLHAVREKTKDCLLPGMLINMKKSFHCRASNGSFRELRAGRLETTMQNIADAFVVSRDQPLSEGQSIELPTFVTYGARAKTISVTKNPVVPGQSIHETPAGCYFEVQRNAHNLFQEHCGVAIPPFPSEEEFLAKGSPIHCFYHPVLGPLYSIIRQKIRGGRIADGSELQLEIGQLELDNLTLDGSLLISTTHPTGVLTGRCQLINVTVDNAGINWNASNEYWSNHLERLESCSIVLEGDGEFYAKGVTFDGDFSIVVPAGTRLSAEPGASGIVWRQETIDGPSWEWEYKLDYDHNVVVEQKKSGSP